MPATTPTTPTPSTPLISADHINDGKQHLLLAASGSVAAIKLPNILSALSTHANLSIRLILTRSARAFLAGQSAEQPALASLAALPNVDGVYLDDDEWAEPWVRGGKILHIELRRWADVMVIAPLSANSLAKIVGGLCDNLLLSTVRAWDTTGELDAVRSVSGSHEEAGLEAVTRGGEGARGKKKVIVVAPAMNTAMWKHPVTRQHMKVLEGEWNVRQGGWFEVLRPVEKELACGDVGDGAMRDWREVVSVIEERLDLRRLEKK